MIGIFDSGVGGLTVMRAIRNELPSSDIIYFGDIKNAPYGIRTREELSLLTMDAIKHLQDRGADRIVSACNSVSASLAVSLFDAFSLLPQQLIEMVGPTVSYLRHTDLPLTLCATSATIKSGMYQNAFRMIGKEVNCIPLPELAGAIEFGKPTEDIENIIKEGFRNHMPVGVLILACTHYPLVTDAFSRVLGKELMIFDPAIAVAERAQKLFWPQEVRNGSTKFVITKDSDQFRALVSTLFSESSYTIEVLT